MNTKIFTTNAKGPTDPTLTIEGVRSKLLTAKWCEVECWTDGAPPTSKAIFRPTRPMDTARATAWLDEHIAQLQADKIEALHVRVTQELWKSTRAGMHKKVVTVGRITRDGIASMTDSGSPANEQGTGARYEEFGAWVRDETEQPTPDDELDPDFYNGINEFGEDDL